MAGRTAGRTTGRKAAKEERSAKVQKEKIGRKVKAEKDRRARAKAPRMASRRIGTAGMPETAGVLSPQVPEALGPSHCGLSSRADIWNL